MKTVFDSDIYVWSNNTSILPLLFILSNFGHLLDINFYNYVFPTPSLYLSNVEMYFIFCVHTRIINILIVNILL